MPRQNTSLYFVDKGSDTIRGPTSAASSMTCMRQAAPGPLDVSFSSRIFGLRYGMIRRWCDFDNHEMGQISRIQKFVTRKTPLHGPLNLPHNTPTHHIATMQKAACHGAVGILTSFILVPETPSLMLSSSTHHLSSGQRVYPKGATPTYAMYHRSSSNPLSC